MVTLGGGLALISVGQWDEESATTIEMPAVPAEPEADSNGPSAQGVVQQRRAGMDR